MKQKANDTQEEQTLTTNFSFCKTPRFIFYLVANFLFVAGIFIPSGLLPETAFAEGISREKISLTFSLSVLPQVIARLVFGFLAHRYYLHVKQLWSCHLTILGLSMLIIPFSHQFVHYLIFNLVSGYFIGKCL